MKSLNNKFAVCTYSRQGSVVLTPRDLHVHSCDSGLREFMEQSAIKLEKCATNTKTKAIKTISNNKHIFSLTNVKNLFKPATNFIKSHTDTFISIVCVLTFFSLMIK